MNKEWSELNKITHLQIKKKDTYKVGIDILFSLRSKLIKTLVSFKDGLCREAFNLIPSFIERWLYIDGNPYIEIFDVINKQHKLTRYISE